MLDWDVVLGFMPYGRRGVGLCGIATRLVGLFNHVGLIDPRVEIGGMCLGVVVDLDQGGRKPGDLPFLGEHQRDRLAVELDLVVE
jgi:hypothetical protein